MVLLLLLAVWTARAVLLTAIKRPVRGPIGAVYAQKREELGDTNVTPQSLVWSSREL